MLLTRDLYQRMLLNAPLQKGADTLYIVSGYATPGMAGRHLRDVVDNANHKVRVNLIVGMSMEGAITESSHQGLVFLCRGQERAFAGRFQCGYVADGSPVHAKTYAWFRGGKPIAGFVSSANYTRAAFGSNRIEVASPHSPVELLKFYREIEARAIFCTHPDVDGLIVPGRTEEIEHSATNQKRKDENTLTLSFLDQHGRLPPTSGLNWGQRKDRHPNEAYIPVPLRGKWKEIVNSFFPARGVPFTVYTESHQPMVCARRQDYGKAIHSIQSNKLIGEYFRRKLGLPDGAFVTHDHLDAYGRTDVSFVKVDEENYLMDFSV